MTFFLNGPETPPAIKANAPAVDLPTWGEGLGAAGTSAQLENDSNFVAARRRIAVRDDMAKDVVPRLGMDQIRPIIEERNAKAIANGMPSQVVEVPDKVEDAVALLGPNFSTKALELAREAAAADPEAWADIDLSDEAIEAQTNERLRTEYEDAQQILEMMPGGRASAEFLGGMIGITADVKNLPFLALGGGGGSLARVMGREAAINMGAEAAFIPSQFDMAERLDIPDPSVASQLAMAAGAGAILGGGITAAQRGWQYYKGRNQTAAIGRMDDLQTQIMVDQVEDILTSDTPQPFEQIGRLVAEAGDAVQPAPYRLENPINPERPPLLPTDPPEITTTQLEPAPTPDPEAPAQADAALTPKKPASKRPTSLKSFVVNQGGIWKGDEGGDISALEYRRPGFLKNEKRVDSTAGNNGGGLPLDTMRERAVEQGYLPEGATINDLIDALDSDVRGTRRIYSQAEEMTAEEWRIFDGEGSTQEPTPQTDFEAQQPEEGRFYVDRDAYEFGGNPEADIEMVVRGWMDKNGWSDILTDAEAREIITVLQERGGDPEYLVERALEREVDYVKSPEIENDIPFGEPDQPRASATGQPASGPGQPQSQPEQARGGGAGDAGVEAPARATESTAGYGDEWQERPLDDTSPPEYVYHGTSNGTFDKFDPYGGSYGLMGSGSYFTENPNIALEYTAKGKGTAPAVYQVKVDIKNPIDMDAPADIDAWANAFDDIDGDELRQIFDGTPTNEDIYREVEDALSERQIPDYEGAEIMQDGLREMGHDGVTHIGGGRAKASSGTEHRVWIAFDDKQIAQVQKRDVVPDRATESTAAGEQSLIDGVAPVTTRDRLQAQQDAPMRGGNAAADDGLFDVGSRSQTDMFSDPTSPEARAVQDVVANDMRTEIEADGDFDLEIETPDGGKRVMSASDLLDYLDEGDAFSARIDLCGKGPT